MPAETTAEDTNALVALVDLVTPFAVRTAVALELPQLVRDGHTRTADLAVASGAHPDALQLLMRHLVTVGLFAEPAPGEYALAGPSRALLDDRHAGLRRWLDAGGPGAKLDLAYGEMLHSVCTGEAAYAQVHGVDFWSDHRRDERLRQFVGDSMAAHAWRTGRALAAGRDWSGVSTVLDVGGGTGALLAAVLEAHPHLTGVVLDLPEVRPDAEKTLAGAGVAARADFRGGSFVDPLPSGYDVLLVSRVLSGRDDTDAARILRRCADAVRADDGRVVVLEVPPSEERATHGSSFDLQLLTLLGGRRRSVEDVHALAGRAGLSPHDVREAGEELTVLEYVAV